MYSHYKPMSESDFPGRGLFGSQGYDWQDLLTEFYNITTYKI